MATVLGAIASNAGDYFHFTYFVRRMLEMIHPRSTLVLLEMEGISPDDLESAGDVYIADVSEYYGDGSFDSAEKVIISQLKYSYANATQNWTLSELCRNDKDTSGKEKPQTSLIGELAKLFGQYLTRYGETAINKIQLQIFTNRPLQPTLKQDLMVVLETLEDKSPRQISPTLANLSQTNPRIASLLNHLREAASFPNKWKHLGLFLRAINWEAFDQADNNQQKQLIFEEALQFSDDFAEDWYRNLLVFTIEWAREEQVRGISEKDVYNALGISEKFHLFPAMYQPDPSNLANYQSTRTYAELHTQIDEISSGFLLVHGGFGTGKSTTIQHLAETYQAVPVYGAWAGQPGEERYPLSVFLTQLVNDIDRLYETNILAIARDDIQSLKLRFRKALAIAARKAQLDNHKLVIAIDAADEACKQHHEHSNKRFDVEDLFVDLLFEFELPENCICVISSRTENIQLLNLPHGVARIETKGFNFTQTAIYARSYVAELSDQAIKLLYQHSEGIPRVIDLTLQIGLKQEVSDWNTHIPRYAKVPLERAYEEAMKDVERDISDIDQFLAIFQELQGPVSISLLAAVVRKSTEQIKDILNEKVYFGLSLNQAEHIVFSNKNFEDFVNRYTEARTNDAKQEIAAFCTETFPDDYAISHIVFHLYRAGQFDTVVTHLLANVQAHLAYLSFQEDFLSEIQYGLIAAVNTQQYLEAVQLLTHAAALAHGGDVFANTLENYPDLVVEYSYEDRLLDHSKRNEFEADRPTLLLSIAAALAQKSKRPELSTELIRHSRLAIERESLRLHRDLEGISWDSSEIIPFVLHTCFTQGLGSGLELLLRWHPEENIYVLFAKVVKRYVEVAQQNDAVHSVENADLSNLQKAHAFYGWLAAGKYAVDDTLNHVLRWLEPHLKNILISKADISDYAKKIVMNLLSKQISADVIDKYLALWQPKELSEHDFDYPTLGYVRNFLRWRATKEVLGLGTFDPEQYTFRESTDKDAYRNDERLKTAREILSTHYRVILEHMKVLRNKSSWDDLKFTFDVIEHWPDDVYYYPYYRASKSRFTDYVCETLRAIIACPDVYFQTVESIVTAAENYLSQAFVGARPRLINILALRPEYFAIAESLIDHQINDITTSRLPASERVDSILSLCATLRSMEMYEQADGVFRFARKSANQWDRLGFGRGLALVAAAEAVQRGGQSLTRIESKNLLDVFDYVNDIQDNEGQSLFEEVLTTVSRNHLDIALMGVHRADYQGHIDLGVGLTAVAKGIQDDDYMIWPLMHTMKYLDVSTLLTWVEKHKASIDLPTFLARLGWRIRLELSIDSQVTDTTTLLKWAQQNGLANDVTTLRMQKYMNHIRPIKEQSHARYTTAKQTSKSNLILSNVPLTAFQELKAALTSDEKIDISSLLQTIQARLPAFTKNQMVELVDLIVNQEYQAPSSDLDIFVFLVDVAESVGVQAYHTSSLNKVKQSLLGFAEKRLHSLLIYYYYRMEREKSLRIAHSPAIDDSTFFKAVLHPIAVELTQLTSDRMYMAIAFLTNRLSDKVQIVFEMLLEGALDAINPDVDNSAALNNENQDLIDFLFNYLGDPRFEVCWRIVYTLVDMSLHVPDILLPRLFERARDTTHERWMSVLDWLMLIARHISLCKPDLLIDYVPELEFHALNDAFPHARIREHAKQSILAVNEQHPLVVDQALLEQIERVNEPLDDISGSNLDADGENNLSYSELRQRLEEKHRDVPFKFYVMDTIEDWYTNLGRCFDENGYAVADAAMKWVAEWQVTDDMCASNRDWLRDRFGSNTMVHRYKNDFPPVVGLRTYVEYHALHLVAGEWIDSKPVHIRDDDGWSKTWQDWVKANIYYIDPVLIGRLADSPPLNPQNFDISPTDFQIWASLEASEDFIEILEPQEHDSSWIVVSESSDAQSSDYRFSVYVKAVTVSEEVAAALGRAISTEPAQGYVGLPEYELEHETKLHMIEDSLTSHDLGIDLINLSYGETNELIAQHPLFEMYPLVAHWDASEDIGKFDSYLPEQSPNLCIPSPQFIELMQLERVPLTLDYVNGDEEIVGQFETWFADHFRTEFGGNERYAKGSRYLLHKDILNSYLRKTNRALVLKVNITRNRPYRYGKDEDRDLWGKTRGFIYDTNGNLSLC